MNLEFRCTHKDDSESDEIRVWIGHDDTSEPSKYDAQAKIKDVNTLGFSLVE